MIKGALWVGRKKLNISELNLVVIAARALLAAVVESMFRAKQFAATDNVMVVCNKDVRGFFDASAPGALRHTISSRC